MNLENWIKKPFFDDINSVTILMREGIFYGPQGFLHYEWVFLWWFSTTNVNSWPPIVNEHHAHPIVKIITFDLKSSRLDSKRDDFKSNVMFIDDLWWVFNTTKLEIEGFWLVLNPENLEKTLFDDWNSVTMLIEVAIFDVF